jgi:hypothetical protein
MRTMHTCEGSCRDSPISYVEFFDVGGVVQVGVVMFEYDCVSISSQGGMMESGRSAHV